jgi:phosphoribosylanthranilate isomerase
VTATWRALPVAIDFPAENMTRIRTKICGLKTLDALDACISGGADAVGLVFHPSSPRYVDSETASSLSRAGSPFVTVVGLFVDAPLETVLDTARHCRLHAIQLHGNESPDFCVAVREHFPVIKAFRLKDQGSISVIPPYHGCVDAFLLDAYVAGRAGGTGQIFDWSLFGAVRAVVSEPLILAGGLTPENVREAADRLKPYAVDTSSGVESEPGRKDPERIRLFLSNLQGAS